ncbi:MAG: hypothetical protein RLZZ455_91, partial [Candidatus Parcubacteria bacterium]
MKKIAYILLPFLYLFLLLFQIDQSMLEDLGRHLKMGEVILQCLCVPQTNLFSYTHPDFPVVNHEWLTQVILFFFYKHFGLTSLLFVKIAVIMLSFAIVYYLAKKKSSWYWLTLISFVCIIIFSSRFRVRPEMFSYLFLALFLLILSYYQRAKRLLLLLPLLMTLWVNMHIYFILGFMLYGSFLLQEFLVTKKPPTFLLIIGGLLFVATLLNPEFVDGALLPFTFSANYGLSVQENMSVFEFGKYAPSFIYTLTLQVMTFEIVVGIFLLTAPLLFKKTAVANITNGLFSALLGLRFVRSISIFGLLGLEPLSEKMTLIEKNLRHTAGHHMLNTVKTLLLLSVLFVTYLYADGLHKNKVLQFGFQPYAEDATNFINNNQVQGPIFNNYQIGNYLIYGLYPREKIFIDARPEMYPKEFLSEYERMLVDQDFFDTQVHKYGINLIVFGVQMEDPETIRPFLLRQIESKKWIPI